VRYVCAQGEVKAAQAADNKDVQFLLSTVSIPPHDGASVLACASQLKVWSRNPKDFEYWFCQRLIDNIHNVFIKQHQRGRWLLAQSVTHASQRVPNSNKNTSKINRTLFTFYGTR